MQSDQAFDMWCSIQMHFFYDMHHVSHTPEGFAKAIMTNARRLLKLFTLRDRHYKFHNSSITTL